MFFSSIHIFISILLKDIIIIIGSAIYCVYYLQTKSEHLKGFIHYFTISLKDKIEVYKIGVSELLMTVFNIITTLLLNNFSMAYGDSVVAAFGIALRIVQIDNSLKHDISCFRLLSIIIYFLIFYF